MYATALKNGAAVLMARIVDAAGVSIRPSWVAAIEYSIYEIDQHRRDRPKLLAGHDAVPLDVGEVMFDTLQTGGSWTVDVSGYNFRHEIGRDQEGAFFKSGARYQVRYVFTPMFGQTTIVRFQLGCLKP